MRYPTILALLIVPVLGLIFVTESDTLISNINNMPNSVDTIVAFVPFSLILISATGLIALIASIVYITIK
jgi:hypothetical protein